MGGKKGAYAVFSRSFWTSSVVVSDVVGFLSSPRISRIDRGGVAESLNFHY